MASPSDVDPATPGLGLVRESQHSLASDLVTMRSLVFTGREAVLAQAELLEELARESAQPGAMHGLEYLLDEQYAARKIPHLVCLVARNAGSQEGLERLVGAVVLLEYCMGPMRTGLVATGDSFGVRTVVGPESLRPSIAAEACVALLARGARMVLVSFKQEHADDAPWAHTAFKQNALRGVLWSVARREVQDHLPLGPTFEATLGSLGKRTRTHLRAYRKRLEEAMPCTFVRNAVPELPLDDVGFLTRLNRRSLEPTGQAGFDLQVRATARLRGGFVCGLRTAEGAWLALAGGWRQGDTTWVEWQVNAAGYEKFSVGTGFRSFLIEDEVARGARRLGFHGGTSHSMAHSFPKEQVTDLLARRRGVVAWLLVRLVPQIFRQFPRLAARGNFLGDALNQTTLPWTKQGR